MIVTFLAVLEMVRLQAVALMQTQNFDEIRLRRHKMFDTICATDGSIARMSEIDEQYL
jgi:chromatin segregation and condensation protein Rec8/ScpA/Scc1 (kleisin family)